MYNSTNIVKEKSGHFYVSSINTPDWPMERRFLYRTQYLHMQNAQSTLPDALCRTYCLWMPPGRKDLFETYTLVMFRLSMCSTR